MYNIRQDDNLFSEKNKKNMKKSVEADKQNIKFSIIVPTYFEEDMLENLLQKFDDTLKQKYNFELIVSDGGSTDKTLDIAQNYADKIVEKTDEKRQTISEGRNCGANVAESDVLVFLNADCMPQNIISFLDYISFWADDLTQSDAIACKVRAFNEEELLRDRIFYFLHNNYVKLLNAIGVGMGRGECQIVRTKVFRELGGYNAKFAAGEDFDLYRRIAKNGYKIEFSEKLLIMESPRRFRKYGYLKTIWFWTLNALTVMFFKKSASKEWEAIR